MTAQLIHQSDTAPPEPMPKLNHVWRREGVYYFRMAIPRELKRAGMSFEVDGKKMGHEIKFSLRVSDYRSAALKTGPLVAIWRENFDARMKELAAAKEGRDLKHFATSCNVPTADGPALIVTDKQIRAILIREFVGMQKDTAKAVEALRGSDEDRKMEVVGDLGMELRGYENDREGESGIVMMLRKCLASYGLESLPIASPAFQSLLTGFRAALLEDLNRRIHLIAGGAPAEFDPMFKGIHAGSIPRDAKASMTLAELHIAFNKAQIAARVKEKTLRSNKVVFRALFAFFEDTMPIEKIDRQKMTEFFDFLDTVPVHAVQRFKGKSLQEAIALEAKQGESRLLGPRTKNNYHQRVVTIFEYAKELEIIEKNPASTKTLLARFHDEKKSGRPPFTVEEMNMIFKAPLFTGCKDDAKGWSKPGPNHPRRGRYWVSLLAMFNGLRCNEACQLEVSDVLTVEDVACIRVTDETNDEEGTGKGKSVKNQTSKTTVPIHPRLIEMGFLEFVKTRIGAGDGSQLFPELPRTREGRYADIFSKWFRRFLTNTIAGRRVKASFHSFRHSFRDAERVAKINPDIALRLGRWAAENSAANAYGNGFPMPLLRDELAKVDYPGVDLSHLMPQQQRIRTPAHIVPGYPKA
jgi:integrase